MVYIYLRRVHHLPVAQEKEVRSICNKMLNLTQQLPPQDFPHLRFYTQHSNSRLRTFHYIHEKHVRCQSDSPLHSLGWVEAELSLCLDDVYTQTLQLHRQVHLFFDTVGREGGRAYRRACSVVVTGRQKRLMYQAICIPHGRWIADIMFLRFFVATRDGGLLRNSRSKTEGMNRRGTFSE